MMVLGKIQHVGDSMLVKEKESYLISFLPCNNNALSICQIDMATNPNPAVMYTFRFANSDKLVHLNQEQLDSVPYLSALVAHKDDFLSIRNENNEYVLNPPIHYNWLRAILHSINSEQAYTLFNELPEDENILNTLQLFDYLGINPFPLPLFNEYLVQSNTHATGNENRRPDYQVKNLLEVRQTAAEFIIALSKNKYDLHNTCIMQRVFYIIKVILSNAPIFSSRFRQHTLTIVKEYCVPLFSNKQLHILPTASQIARRNKIESLMYLYDDNNSLPVNFEKIFPWKVSYSPIEEDSEIDAVFSGSPLERLIILFRAAIRNLELFLQKLKYESELGRSEYLVDDELKIYQTNNERQSVRSRRFNTLHRRPTVDKFKNRSGRKTKKYR